MTKPKSKPLSASEIIDALGGSASLARQLLELPGMQAAHVHVGNWKRRQQIPGPWLYPVLLVANLHGVKEITSEALLRHAASDTLNHRELMRKF